MCQTRWSQRTCEGLQAKQIKKNFHFSMSMSGDWFSDEQDDSVNDSYSQHLTCKMPHKAAFTKIIEAQN